MHFKVLEHSKNKIKIEVGKEDLTILNALRKELWQDKDTDIAGFRQEHHLVANPILVLESKKDAKKSLLDAIDRLRKKNKDFKTKIKTLK